MDDDRLLERLGQTLLADPVLPDDAERAALHLALRDAPAETATARSSRGIRMLRRPVAAGVAAAILLSGGAAAAVETSTLPGPLRSIAATLGLPMPPSALAQAQNAVADLSHALAARDTAGTRAALTSLLSVLPALSVSDRAQLGPGVAELIAEAEIFLAGQPAKSSRDSRDPIAGPRRSAEGSGDAGPSSRVSGDGLNGTDDRGSTGEEASGVPNAGATGVPAATGGISQPDGNGSTSGSAATVGATDGAGIDGGGPAPSASSGTPTSVGTTGSDGGSGSIPSIQSSGPDGGSTNSVITTGSDGSGSDGGTSGSDGGTSGGTPR